MGTLERAKRLGAPQDIAPALAPYWVRLKESTPTLVFDAAFGLRFVGDDHMSKYGGLFLPFIKGGRLHLKCQLRRDDSPQLCALREPPGIQGGRRALRILAVQEGQVAAVVFLRHAAAGGLQDCNCYQ